MEETNPNEAPDNSNCGEAFSHLDEFETMVRPHSVASNYEFSDDDESLSLFRLGRGLQPSIKTSESSFGPASAISAPILTRANSCPAFLSEEIDDDVNDFKDFRETLPDFFRSHSRCSRDTMSTLPLSPRGDSLFDPNIIRRRSDSVITVRDDDFTTIPEFVQPPAFDRFKPLELSNPDLDIKNSKKASTLQSEKSEQGTTDSQKENSSGLLDPNLILFSTKAISHTPSNVVVPKPVRAAEATTKKKKTPPRSHKKMMGLKNLSRKICETLSSMGSATQEDMISVLYKSFVSGSDSSQHESEKSIRRRIYDTLNVLMALGMVRKSKQQIEWTGHCIDQASQEHIENKINQIKDQLSESKDNLVQKRKQLDEETLQYGRTKTLLDRNLKRIKTGEVSEKRVCLPFLVVRAPQAGTVRIEFSENEHQVRVDFQEEMEICNDYDVLTLMAQS